MTIEERVHGGKVFRSCWDLVEAEAAELTLAARENFWSAFRDAMKEKFPEPSEVPGHQEYLSLANLLVPFGFYKGRWLQAVFDDAFFLDYLVWFANQTFVDKLRRFLKHPNVVRAIEKRTSDKFRGQYDGEDHSGSVGL